MSGYERTISSLLLYKLKSPHFSHLKLWLMMMHMMMHQITKFGKKKLCSSEVTFQKKPRHMD